MEESGYNERGGVEDSKDCFSKGAEIFNNSDCIPEDSNEGNHQYVKILGTLPEDFPFRCLMDTEYDRLKMCTENVLPFTGLEDGVDSSESKNSSYVFANPVPDVSFESVDSKEEASEKPDISSSKNETSNSILFSPNKVNLSELSSMNASLHKDSPASEDGNLSCPKLFDAALAYPKSSNSSTEMLSFSDSPPVTSNEEVLKTEDSFEVPLPNDASKENFRDLKQSPGLYEMVEVIKCNLCSGLFENKKKYIQHSCFSKSEQHKNIPPNLSVDQERAVEEDENLMESDIEVEQDTVKETSQSSDLTQDFGNPIDIRQIYIIGEIKTSSAAPETRVSATLPHKSIQELPDREAIGETNDIRLNSNRRQKKLIRCSKERCRLKFSTVQNREVHERCHNEDLTSQKTLSFLCYMCQAQSSCWSKMQTHLWRLHQLDVEMLTCTICNKYKAPRHYQIKIHSQTHSDVKEHQCQSCPEVFSQLSQLLNHQKIHNDGCKKRDTSVRKNSCRQCHYTCYNSHDLKKHLLTHSERASCRLCSQSFKHQTSLHQHILLLHLSNQLLHCPCCPFTASLPNVFNQHFNGNHREVETRFTCKICGDDWNSLEEYCKHSLDHRTSFLCERRNKTDLKRREASEDEV